MKARLTQMPYYFFNRIIMEYLKELGSVFGSSLSNVWAVFASFVPVLLLAIVLFVVGMLIAKVVGKAIAQVITVTRVDKLFESAGLGDVLAKAGLKLDIGKFFGVIVKWFIVIVFLMASLQIVQLTDVSVFIGKMAFLYVPKIIIIAIIFILAAIIADAIKKIVITSAKVANINKSETLGAIAKYAVWAVAVILILSQFEDLKNYMLILFGGVMLFVVIAGGISFGLGGKEAAARAIEKASKELSAKE